MANMYVPESFGRHQLPGLRILSNYVATVANFNAFGCATVRNALTYRNLEQCHADGAIRLTYLGLWPWEEKS